MRIRRFVPVVLLATLLAALTGCLGNRELRGIAVQLVEVTATPSPDGSAELRLQIRYINENLVAIAVSETEHHLSLNGTAIGRVESEDAVGLPQLGEATQPVHLRVDAQTVQRLRTLQAAGVANYRLETTLMVEAATDELRSRAVGTGPIDLSNLGL